MRGWRAVAAALVLVVAGCAGGLGGGDGTPTAAETPDRTATQSTDTTGSDTSATPRTATPTPAVSEDRRQELRAFADRVDAEATRPAAWRFDGPETAVVRVPAAHGYRRYWDRRNMTVFEAVAEASAAVDDPPERVLVEVENRSGVHAVTVPVNASVARAYADHRITTPEFREHAAEGAYAGEGEFEEGIVGVAAPDDQQRRWDYAIALNRSLDLTYSEVVNTSVTDDLVVVQQGNETVATRAVRLTIRHPRELDRPGTEVNEYNITIREQAVGFRKIVENKRYGERPKLLQIRYVDRQDELYAVHDMNTRLILSYAYNRTDPSIYTTVYIISGKFVNGGVPPE